MKRATLAGADTEDVPPECTTLDRLFTWRECRTPQATAYRQFDAAAGLWVAHTWRDVGVRIRRFVEAFATLSIARGARVAVLLRNGVDAVCVDQAALACACVPVPLHALDNPQSIAYILADSDATVLFVEDETQWKAIAALGTGLPSLRWVVVKTRRAIQVPSNAIAPVTLSLDGFLATSALLRTHAASPEPTRPDELAAIVYTSGTTGRPKGVMLTHANVMANVRATLRRVASHPGDELLSFLPLSHTFERTVGYYLPIAAGACVAYARSVADLAEDLRHIRPTILVSVPRIYERVQVQVDAALRAAPWRLAVFQWAARTGWRRFQHAGGLRRVGLAMRLVDALTWPLLDRVAAAPLRAQFGGRLRLAVSGGAPLSPAIAHAFIGLGVPIVQGYGMTETAPVVACNAPDDNDPATVGRVLDGVEVRIGDNDELQVRGPSVMRGYWKRDADTANAFVDGWLRTGDQAAIENGRVRILGRIKEILVTSTGEKVAPADVELAIAADPLFEQVALVGEARPFIACIVVLNRALWSALASSLGLDPSAPESLAAAAAIAAVLDRIRRQTTRFPAPSQPRRVLLTLEPWTMENTLLTPTLKLKRLNLDARFSSRIAELYEGR